MATAPISGTLSPAQQAVLEQIRALRAAKPVRTAPAVAEAAPVQAKPVAAAASARPQAVRGRGSIVNIVA
ncbi:MAG TPA: hypothetical protein VGL83_10025 [Stellaceae bacterium]|jgi:hypothetical protein